MLPVLPTPFDEGGKLDTRALETLVRELVPQGIHGLVVLGSNGEFPYLAAEEKLRAIRAAVKAARGRVPVVAGTGAMGTDEAVSLTREAFRSGARAVLVALPTYYPVRLPEALDYYRRVAAEGPTLYYHFPATTHLRLSPEEVGKIAELEGIVGMKGTLSSLPEIRSQIAAVRKRPFSYFVGTSFLLREVLAAGGQGTICPIPCLLPRLAVSLYRAASEGKGGEARALERSLFSCLPVMNPTPLPPALARLAFLAAAKLGVPVAALGGTPQASVKEALRLLGFPLTNRVRSPLPPLGREDAERVARTVETLVAKGWAAKRNGRNPS